MYVSPDLPGVPEVQPIPRPSVGWRRRPVPDDMLLEPAANRPFTTDEERPEVAWAPPAERRAVEAPAADSLDIMIAAGLGAMVIALGIALMAVFLA